MNQVWIQEAVFLALAIACIGWAQWRLPVGTARFPGPRPPRLPFKVWLVIIWIVGLLLPLAALVWDGIIGGSAAALTAVSAYLLMLFAQVACEIFCWKRLGSPVWVIVPCLFLPWRLWQSYRGLELVGDGPALSLFTFYALFVLWVINIGVHYTNIPGTLRWDYHDPTAKFPSLHDPRVFTSGAADPSDEVRNSSRS